ncbi:hypothetical protein FKM82_009396 [Ascaphus truei]
MRKEDRFYREGGDGDTKEQDMMMSEDTRRHRGRRSWPIQTPGSANRNHSDEMDDVTVAKARETSGTCPQSSRNGGT